MRRILAITLLIAFGFPLLAPAFAATADPEASLPPCCRSHGTHHCAMMHRMLVASNGPSFTPPPCPFYPTPSTSPRTVAASLAAPPRLAEAQLLAPAPRTASPHRAAATFIASANLKRGPPALLA
jgi:hypothetical protein